MDGKSFTSKSPGKLVPVEGQCFAYIPGDLPPELEPSWALVNAMSDADRAVSELAGVARTLPNPHLLIRPFINREAVLSSRIEGTQASLSDLYMLQGVEEGSLKSTLPSDVFEVLNYIHALEHGLSRLSDLPLSIRLIKELHQILMGGVRGDNLAPGELRVIQNWIGPTGCTLKTATYVPPPVPDMKKALESLEVFFHNAGNLPPLVRLAIIHYQFEAIHPFLDGNGRIGRLLIALILCTDQVLPQPLLYLSAYFEKNRRQYYDLLLEVSQEGAWENWIIFFLTGVAEQSRDAIRRSKNLLDLWQHYRDALQGSRVTGLQLRMLDTLFKTPIITNHRICTELGITPRAAQQNIDKLVESKILSEITGRQRNRVFSAQEIMNITDAPVA